MSEEIKGPPEAKADAKADDSRIENGKVVLSEAKREDIKRRAKKQIEAEALKKAEQAAFDQALAEERRAVGMHTGTPDDEIVPVTIDLPDPEINSCLLVNGKAYYHGFTYQVPKHVKRSFDEAMYRLKAYTAREIEGKKMREFYQRPRNPRINGSTGEVMH